MTNQEAISIIEEHVIGGGCTDFIYEALQMAINALELSDAIMKQLDCKEFHGGATQ